MNDNKDIHETIGAGEMASIENTYSKELSVSLLCGNGCRVDMELAPGQVVQLSAGAENTQVILHNGDPVNLLIIKPESAS
ncbi:MAG: hypothetical protein HWE39_08980 [Oceanospirillaceae bacterium]|nr:hypothetical protein [Oceanospirillaceae bacterium]